MLPIIMRVVDVNFGIIIILYLSEILTSMQLTQCLYSSVRVRKINSLGISFISSLKTVVPLSDSHSQFKASLKFSLPLLTITIAIDLIM